MSEINTVDNARAVAVDTSNKRQSRATEAANASAQAGKRLPVQDTIRSTETPQAVQRVAQESSVQVEKAVEQLNEYVQSLQRDLRFSLDEELGRAVVRVIDRSTQEVIRQIPNETALQLARNLKAEINIESAELAATGTNGGSGVEASLGLINTRI